jgi:hypothetical protein
MLHMEAAGPVGGRGRPPCCLEANVYFASDDAAFVTATDLLIDGGYIASKAGSQPTAVPRRSNDRRGRRGLDTY